MDNKDKIAARIAARKALGMTAAEYNAFEKQLARQLAEAKQRAIDDAIRAVLTRDNKKIDAALARCRSLGLTP